MNKTLHVANLAASVTETSLSRFFSRAGVVTGCRVVIDRRTGQSRGLGFVEMSTEEQAEIAVVELQGHRLEGRAVSIRAAKHLRPGRTPLEASHVVRHPTE